MTQPLALAVYGKLLPGTQLVNRLQDLGYRVQTLSNPADLEETALRVKPLIVLADLDNAGGDLRKAISGLKRNPATSHLPIVVFGALNHPESEKEALHAGASLVVSEAAILNHLPQCLERALQLE